MASRTTARQRRHTRAIAAFTLIEVLMSIFVLALGLLGLGALIPGIIREQRVASDRTLGIIVANDAEAYLRARSDLDRLYIPPSAGTGLGSGTIPRYGFGQWLFDPEWSETYGWDLNSIDRSQFEEEGDFVLDQVGRSTLQVRVPLADRLYPSPSSDVETPQFVWDFVARRLPPIEAGGYALLADVPLPLPTDPQFQVWRAGVEIAVFVRRVDTGIRVPRGTTAYELMLRPNNPVLPVGLDGAGLPTGAGADTSTDQIYAPPLTLEAEYDGQRTNVLTLTDLPDGAGGEEPGSGVSAEQRRLLAAQIGQQLVDNLGNIYTVEEVLGTGSGEVELRIRPSIDRWIPGTDGIPGDWDDERSWTQINQVMFVPQPPAATFVFRVGVEPEAVRSPSGSGAGRQPL